MKKILAALFAVIGLGALSASPALAQSVANPGTLTATAGTETTFTLPAATGGDGVFDNAAVALA